MNYLSWKEETISDFNQKNISDMYGRGFVFTRKGRGVMQQTRSVRIDLVQFELSSENRRILKKISTVAAKEIALPVTPADYHWSLGKMAKDFYEKKFGAGVMSASKIKELLTDGQKSNFNTLISFSHLDGAGSESAYAICYKNSTLLHYSYPFYDLEKMASGEIPKDIGLGMMILAIEHAKTAGLAHIYLGSLQRPSDTYKLQFKGLEWFDGGPGGTSTWQRDIEKAKNILK